MTEREDKKKRRVTAAEKKRRGIRDIIWPGLDEERLWLRQGSVGFITIPRTLPLIVEIINCMTKGAPAGSAYLELWCRSFDECYVDMDDEEGMAFTTGFSGQRAVTTWRGRIRSLQELGFIDVKAKGGHTYALIYSPYQVIYQHHLAKTPGLTDDHYAALEIRVENIGASDLVQAKRLAEIAVSADKESTQPMPAKKTATRTSKAK